MLTGMSQSKLNPGAWVRSSSGISRSVQRRLDTLETENRLLKERLDALEARLRNLSQQDWLRRPLGPQPWMPVYPTYPFQPTITWDSTSIGGLPQTWVMNQGTD